MVEKRDLQKNQKGEAQKRRKPYVKPQVIEYGGVEKLTQSGISGLKTDLRGTRYT